MSESFRVCARLGNHCRMSGISTTSALSESSVLHVESEYRIDSIVLHSSFTPKKGHGRHGPGRRTCSKPSQAAADACWKPRLSVKPEKRYNVLPSISFLVEPIDTCEGLRFGVEYVVRRISTCGVLGGTKILPLVSSSVSMSAPVRSSCSLSLGTSVVLLPVLSRQTRFARRRPAWPLPLLLLLLNHPRAS